MKQRPKVFLSFVIIILLAVGAYFVDIPNGPDIHIGNINREIKTHLGLDLQGGTQLVYKADLSSLDSADYDTAMASVRDVIERRVNAFGVSEPVVQTSVSGTEHRLIVELAGVTDVNEAIKQIGQTPLLEFREENPDAATNSIDTSNIDPNDEAAFEKVLRDAANQQYKSTKLTGAQLERAQVDFDQTTGEPIVALKFNSEGRELFADITKRNVGKAIAIFLDGNIISAPVVNQAITTGDAIITGDFSIDEAKDLVERLNAGALPVPISLLSQQTIGASLGQASIEKSIIAGLIGIFLVGLFMVVLYRVPGIIAVVALSIYALIMLALFKLVPVTLTLAGIAGFLLSVGMAVDANVLVFERIKEELRAGGTVNSAISEGFKQAWLSIRDSNFSTLISCVILAWFGTSIIKGFAITLGIGVVVSMFSAIIITRTFLQLIVMTPLRKMPRLFGGPKAPKPETEQKGETHA